MIFKYSWFEISNCLNVILYWGLQEFNLVAITTYLTLHSWEISFYLLSRKPVCVLADHHLAIVVVLQKDTRNWLYIIKVMAVEMRLIQTKEVANLTLFLARYFWYAKLASGWFDYNRAITKAVASLDIYTLNARNAHWNAG